MARRINKIRDAVCPCYDKDFRCFLKSYRMVLMESSGEKTTGDGATSD